ncbi:hypothetical protein ACROYT_G030565 [Oculina patagonica]
MYWDTDKTSVDGKYKVPDQVVFAHHTSCVETTTHKMFSGTKSYQDKLKVDVEASAGYDGGLWNVAFSLSARYEKVNKETTTNKNVFFENKKVCNNGRARYQLDLARAKNYSVTEDFAAAVCALPETFEQQDYLRFVENWGTDIVLEVELGTKTTERFESSYTEIAKYAMENIGATVSVSGGYMGLSASLSVAFDKFKESSEDTSELTKNKVEFSSGGADMPAPIGLKLLPIDEAFSDSYFRVLSQQFQCENLLQRKENVRQLLSNYPNLKGARNPHDPDVRIPLTWPLGTYGLPMTKSGCPEGSFWHEGTRYHDTEDDDSNNYWSNPYDLAGRAAKNNMEQKFCMKTKDKTSGYNLPWPKGRYCIFKKGECPEGLNNATVLWTDEMSDIENSFSGQIPDGSFNEPPFTAIEYCCRTDGYATNEIFLPTESPFVLLKSSHLCQKVKGMQVTSEYFRWDNDNMFGVISQVAGAVNAERSDAGDIKIHYCYYHK